MNPVTLKKLCYAGIVGVAIGTYIGMYETKEERIAAARGLAVVGITAVCTYLGAKKAAEQAFEDINVQVFIRRNTSDEYTEAKPIETVEPIS